MINGSMLADEAAGHAASVWPAVWRRTSSSGHLCGAGEGAHGTHRSAAAGGEYSASMSCLIARVMNDRGFALVYAGG
jgi:hypothetical protein